MARSFTQAEPATTYLSRTSAVVSAPPFTVSAWVWPTDAATGQIVAGVSNSTSGTFYSRARLILSGDVGGDPVRFGLVNSSGTNIVAATSTGYATGSWQHVAGWADASGVAAYLDGGGKGTASGTTTVSGMDRTFVGGQILSTGVFNGLGGNISDVAVWDTVLTDDEIAVLSRGTSPLLVRPGSLVAYWPLVGRRSPEIDVVGGNNLTITGSVPRADHHRTFAPRRSQRSVFVPPITPEKAAVSPRLSAPRQPVFDTANAVNWDHPDNRGLSLMLTGLPGTGAGAGNVWKDLTRKTAGGTLVNGPTWVGTPWGQSGLRVTAASNQHASVSGNNLNPTVAISIAVWVRLASYQINANVVSKPNADGAVSYPFTQWGIKFNSADGKKPGFEVTASGTVGSAYSTSDLPLLTWSRLVGVYNGLNITLFVNGIQVAQSAKTGLLNTYNSTAQVGRWGGGGSQYLDGAVSDVRVWLRALTTDEVARDYQWSRDPASDHRLNRVSTRTYFLPPYTATTRKTGYAPWIPGLGW